MLLNRNLNTVAHALVLLGALGLFSAGCGQAPSHTAALNVDPAFSDYVSRFEQASVTYGRPIQVTDLTMQFGQVDSGGESGARGDCSWVSGQTPVVTLSADAWSSSTDAEREELVFHELGHCVLGEKHVAGINDQGIPRSIMDPSEISGAIYSQNRDYYLTTLFQP